MIPWSKAFYPNIISISYTNAEKSQVMLYTMF
jgi:hypothetical protein